MASITTISPFVNGTAMVAGDWNTKYDLLYNELNGNLDNTNIATTSGTLESKIQFTNSGHEHSSVGKPLILTSISTAGINKGGFLYYDGTNWATFGTGANATHLKYGFDTYTKLVIHFDGADGATSYTAETTQAVTFVGTSQLDTDQKIFGSSSLLLNGSSDYVTVPDSADWYFGSGSFTLDFWARFNSVDISKDLIGQYTDDYNRWGIYYSGGDKYLSVFSAAGGSNSMWYHTPFNPSVSNWYHIAVVRNGNAWNTYINGTSGTVNTLELGSYSNNMPDVASELAIGCVDRTYNFFSGWIDEVRVSKGVARWTSNFATSSTAYPIDLLWG